jgi:methylmalonyl-CoA/ethylmalonyl-CoA epimerase
MKHIEHLGIAVKSLVDAEKLYTALYNTKPYKEEVVESEGVKTLFYRIGGHKVELLEALHHESPIARFIEKKGEGLHHVAFEVEDIRAEMERLEKEGFQLLTKEPKRGADNKWVAFLHPKSTGGMLVEICQDQKP